MNFGRLIRFATATASLMAVTLAVGACQAPDQDWRSHGLDSNEQRFSPLSQIDTKTVQRLGLAWSLDLPDENALEATPLAVGGKLYFPGGFGRVYGVDAVSGKLDWTYDAQDVPTDPTASARIYGVNRGVAFWDGKVFYASRDGRMIALDAQTGKPVWTTKFLKPEDNSASTGAPRVFGDKLIIGSSGAEMNGRGFVSALDGKTGKLLWRFYVVPGNPAEGFEDAAMEMAAKTWSGEWWKFGGGGNAWNGITYDEEFGQILIGTGNGGPWNCHERANAPDKTNLFVASVVAIDEKTGKYKWHYQYNPRECWDWKATADIVLADLSIDGETRKVMMQAPSNGFFYVIDRKDGRLLSADKWAKANWADSIDLTTGLPVEKPGIRYESGPIAIYPGTWGAHSWQASAFNPATGLVYIPYMQMGMIYSTNQDAMTLARADMDKPRLRTGVELDLAWDKNDPRDNKGSLVAWDPLKKRVAWRADYDVFFTGGAMTTAGGLTFHGTTEGLLYAYDAATGRKLWTFDAKNGIYAPPITYSVRGKQYVSILVGPGGGVGEMHVPGAKRLGWKFGLQPRRLLTFALDAEASLPETPPPEMTILPLDDPSLRLDPARVRRGGDVYSTSCTFCHGGGAVSAGGAPDLRESGMALDRAAFREVVVDGLLLQRGMPKIDVSDEQLEDVYQFIRAAAREEKARQAAASQ